MTKHYEDLAEGDEFSFHEYTVSESKIREFATAFDPQPFHLDREAATASVFDDLVASGWHTASISMRLLVDDVFSDVAIMGGRGVDNLRWYEPVYPDDTLTGGAKVVAKSPDKRDPNRGNVPFAVTIVNQQDNTVMTYTTMSMVRRCD